MKKILKKKKILIVIILLIILLVVAGLLVYFLVLKKDEEVVNNVVENMEEEIKEVTIIDVNSKTRSYAVMINCLNAALPQSGLQDAYIVYELMVEGGITRMLALFKDVDVEKIGSVRSARTQYIDYVMENDAIYVHAGGASDAKSEIKSLDIDDIDLLTTSYGYRDYSLGRATEHTLFTSTELLTSGVEAKKYDTETEVDNLLTYSTDEIDLGTYEGAIEASSVSIKYSSYRTSIYEYDESNLNYLRYMNSTANTDLVTEEQYTVKNIIVYAVKYSSYSYGDHSGYQSIDNIGTGEGYYISDGYAIEITWEKSSRSSQTIYRVKSTGEELVVNDGNTYIQIYPTTGTLTIS